MYDHCMSVHGSGSRRAVPETYYSNVLVASFDALGLRDLVLADDDAQAAMRACDNLVGQVLTAQRAHEKPDGKSDYIEMFDSGVHFGDSIYVWGNISQALGDQIKRMTGLAAAILFRGVWLTVSDKKDAYAPRVGIAAGNLRIRELRVNGKGCDLHIGSSMVRANAIESNQNWVGGALPTELCLQDDPYCMEYMVPTKVDYQGPALGAVNWVALCLQNRALYDPTQLTSDLKRHVRKLDNVAAATKWENTRAFAEYVLEHENA